MALAIARAKRAIRMTPATLRRLVPIIPALLVAVVGITLSCYAFTTWQTFEAATAQNDFKVAAVERIAMLRRGIAKPFDAVVHLKTLIEAVGPVDQAAFARFAAEVLRSNPRIEQLIWAPIHAAAPDDPSSTQASFTVQYVLPASAEVNVGQDIHTVPNYGACLDNALGRASSHQELAPHRDRLCVVPIANGFDLLAILPVLRIAPHDNELPLSGAIIGRMHLRFSAIALNGSNANGFNEEGSNIVLIDLAKPGGANLLHPAELFDASSRNVAMIGGVSQDIRVGSESWRLIDFPTRKLARSASWQSLGVLAACLAITANLSIYLLLIGRQRQRIEAAVTDRTQAMEAALDNVRSSEQRLQDYAAIASDWNWETGKDLCFTYVADQASEHQIEPGQLIGLDRLTLDDAENEVAQRRELLNWHQIFRDLRYDYGTDHGLLTLSLSGLPIFDADGIFQGYRGSARDITLQLQAEAKQRLAHWAAEQANRAKSNFLATMSHELRTPMNGVLGMVQLLSDTTLDQDQRRMCDLIYQSGNSLKQILNDILDYSKLEAGKVALELIDTSLTDIVESVVDLMRGAAQATGLAIKVEISDSSRVPVITDPTRFRQVLFNLVSNAIKFSERGVVTIRMSAEPAGPDRRAITLTVADQGIGISPEGQRRLFARFSQADGSTTRRFGGTGLGLAITRELIILMGGTIDVSSQTGEGTTFTIRMTLPIAEPVVGPKILPRWTTQTADAQTLEILVAEDNEINQEVIKGMLRGHRLTMVADGQQAVEAARTDRFDLVLMDVMMPRMNGLEATAAIRALISPSAGIPIIALTANAMSGDRERYLAAGMSGYVSKPIERQNLFEVIEQVIGVPVMRPLAAEAAPPAKPITAVAALEIDDFIASLSLEV